MTEEEIEQFSLAIKSPIFNNSLNSENLIQLYDLLMPILKDTIKKKLIKEQFLEDISESVNSAAGNNDNAFNWSKKRISNLLFPNTPFRENRIDGLMSKLFKILEQFIVFNKKCKISSEVQNGLVVAEFYRERELENEFKLKIKNLNTEYQKNGSNGSADYYLDYLIKQENYDYQVAYNTSKSNQYLVDVVRSFDYFYIITRLNYMLSLLSFHHQYKPLDIENVPEYFSILEDLNNLIKKNNYQNEPIIKLYYSAIQLIENKVLPEEMDGFKELLDKNGHLLNSQNLIYIRTTLRNYYARQYNKGDNDSLPKVYERYISDLKEGFLFQENKIAPLTVWAFSTICSKVGDVDSVLFFLRNYSFKPYSYNQFIWASYYFEINDFLKCQNILTSIDIKFDEINYYMSARMLEIKLYFELSEGSLFESRTNAFKIYLFANKNNGTIAEHKWKMSNNFNNIIMQIYNTPNFEAKKLHAIEQKIASKKVYAEREWLIKKVEYLKRQNKCK